jgi:hypothetical protein
MIIEALGLKDTKGRIQEGQRDKNPAQSWGW